MCIDLVGKFVMSRLSLLGIKMTCIADFHKAMMGTCTYKFYTSWIRRSTGFSLRHTCSLISATAGGKQFLKATPMLRCFLIMIQLFHIVRVSYGANIPRCSNLSDGTPRYYNESDYQCHSCQTCGVGFGLSEICGDGTGVNAVCKPCESDYFSNRNDSSTCLPCRSCDNTEDDTPCTSTTDRKCGKCIYGYFRYNEKDNHCVKCEDEKYRDLYEDCLQTTPPARPEKRTTEETTRPGSGMTSVEPPVGRNIKAVIPGVVVPVAVIVLLLILIICCKVRKRCPCTNQDPRNSPPSITADNPTSQAEETEIDRLIQGPTEPAAESDVLQQAVPISDMVVHTSDQVNHAEVEGVQEENGQDGPADTPTDLSSGSAPTDNPSNSSQSDNNVNAEAFKKNLEKAMQITSKVYLGDMHNKDLDLLDHHLFERPVLAETKSVCTFNFISLARLYDIDEFTRKQFETARDVITFIKDRDSSHPTVANFLARLNQANKCIGVLKILVDQIIAREKEKDSQ